MRGDEDDDPCGGREVYNVFPKVASKRPMTTAAMPAMLSLV
jgi:hypothetical protein